MPIFFNEASLQGQFRDEEEFRVILDELLSARLRTPYFKEMRIAYELRDRKVLYSQSFREVVQNWRKKDKRALTMMWLDKGPFIVDDRTPEDDDLFYCLGVEVTDGGLGESARRAKANEDVASVSFPGGKTNFAISPLPVVHGLEEQPMAEYPIKNYWDVKAAVETLRDCGELVRPEQRLGI